MAKEFENGLGRETPNQHPILPEPTGRFKFVILYLDIELFNRICFHHGR